MAQKVQNFDAVVLGGGPGGYVAAIRLAQYGKSVALVDKGTLGGVCLNWGCIPSKALIHAAKVYETAKNGEEMGISAKGIKIDFKQTQKWKQDVVKKLTDGIGLLLKSSGVTVIRGRGEFEDPYHMRVETEESGPSGEILEFQHAIVAAGSRPIEIPGFTIDGKNVVDSKDALEWTEPPARMLIIGGGVIGMEIGMLYRKLGSNVTVVEMLDQLLPGVDSEVAQALERICRKKGIDVQLKSKALGYQKGKNGLEVDIETPKMKLKIPFDVILLSVGRTPNSTGLGLEKLNIRIEKGTVLTNSQMQTNVPNIYAIGDIAGPPLLAHKASREGLAAAAAIAGHAEEYDVTAMPGAIFTDPEIATVGWTENEARAKGIDVLVGKFPFAALGRAVSTGHPDGFVKVVAERSTKRILGVHIMGAEASNLISEATLAIEMGASVEDMALTVHPHPTMSEALMEAAEHALGLAIHTVNRKPSPPPSNVETATTP